MEITRFSRAFAFRAISLAARYPSSRLMADL
jgi:hypothetical protein